RPAPPRLGSVTRRALGIMARWFVANPFRREVGRKALLVMATVQSPGEQRLVLYGVSWQEYARMLRAFAERPGVRLTYDRGVLELMTLSLEHESLVSCFNLLILALTLELGVPLKHVG